MKIIANPVPSAQAALISERARTHILVRYMGVLAFLIGFGLGASANISLHTHAFAASAVYVRAR